MINDKWAGTVISTVVEMDCGYSHLAASVTSLQITVHISLSHTLSFVNHFCSFTLQQCSADLCWYHQ